MIVAPSPRSCCAPRARRAPRSRTSPRAPSRWHSPRSATSRSGNAGLVVANVHAMNAAIELSDRLDERAIIAMHDALLAHPRRTSSADGATSRCGSVVGASRRTPPPSCRRTTSSARAHARPRRVRTSHRHARARAGRHRTRPVRDRPPVPRRQGRTGRALLQGMLRAAGVTRNVAVPVSAGLLGDTDGYFAALTPIARGIPAASSRPSPKRCSVPSTTAARSCRRSRRRARAGTSR